MGKPLRVGLIADDASADQYIGELIEWAMDQANISISVIVVHRGTNDIDRHDRSYAVVSLPRTLREFLEEVLWKFITRIERRRLKTSKFSNIFPSSIEFARAHWSAITIGRLDHRVNDRVFSDQDIAALNNENFDLVVQFGDSQEAVDLVGCARLGITQLCYGDDQQFNSCSPGFWEVLKRRNKSRFAIRHFDSKSSRGSVVATGFVPTQAYYLLNQAVLRRAANRQLKLLLTTVMRSGKLPTADRNLPYSGRPQGSPRFIDLASYITVVVARSVVSIARSVVGLEERWGISLIDRKWVDAALYDGRRIENPRGRYFADPFLIVVEGETFCFVEDYIDNKRKGVISVLKVSGVAPCFVSQVIEEDFHLSFPYMFEYENELFMCPEAHQSGQIRLYKCKRFPLEWELHSIAMDGVSAVDTMIFWSAQRWWMLTNIDSTVGAKTFSELHLFSAPNPLSGEWTAHPQNPLIVDPEFARNAGLLRDGDSIFRVSQARAFGSYGVSASIFEIKELDAESYREEWVTTLRPTFRRGLSGMHHFHSSGEYTVWDHKSWERVP